MPTPTAPYVPLRPTAFLLSILDAIPSPLFVADDDVRLLFRNRAAAALEEGAGSLLLARGGEALQCLHATESAGGCGSAPACSDCVIRRSVGQAIGGATVTRSKTPFYSRRTDGRLEERLYLVTASPFPHEGTTLALLLLENVTEMALLRDLVPICCICRKIRNDSDYWESVEKHLGRELAAEFTHALCPDCARKHYGVSENGAPPAGTP